MRCQQYLMGILIFEGAYGVLSLYQWEFVGGVDILTDRLSKLFWGINFHTFEPWFLATPKMNHNLDWGIVQVHWKYPLAGDGFHVKYLLPTRAVAFILETKTFTFYFSGTRDFLTEKLIGFLTPWCWQHTWKLGDFEMVTQRIS